MPKITQIHDNIATIKGEMNYEQEQFFSLSKNANGMVVSATDDEAHLLIIGDPSSIKVKDEAKPEKSNIENIAAMEGYFGSIISPFGDIVFPSGKKVGKKIGTSTLDNNPPLLLDRIPLSKPLLTGMLSIDTMIPIGRGQRELIIGDRTTGKTSIALSTIINQKDNKVKVVYVSIGQKRNSVIKFYNSLKRNDAIKNTTVIFSNPDSAAEQFLAPQIGMAIAEAIAYKGNDVLIILDDLSKHANVYREVALSIGKNPGREAYPTDVFYKHARLLERAGSFNEKYNRGTITCLPIVETIQGDIASLIPSNVISITDGQIFTSTDMFNNGEFPAINIGHSVSRTGSAVQTDLIKKASKGLKAQYSALFDVKKFADLSVDISEDLKTKIEDWSGVNNILIQYGYKGYTPEQMFILCELFRMKSMGRLADNKDFTIAFKKYCKTDVGAKKIIEKIKNGTFSPKSKEFRKALHAVFVPLIKIASNVKTDIISEKEFKKLLQGGK